MALKKLKKILPWLIAAAAFAYLFRQYPPASILKALSQLNIAAFVFYAVIYFVYVGLVDCWSMSWIFSRLGYRVKTRELLPVRCASYLFMVFNYAAAQGMLSYFFKKEKNIPIIHSASLVFLVMGIDLYLTASMAFTGSLFVSLDVNGVPLNNAVQITWVLFSISIIVGLIVIKLPFNLQKMKWEQIRDLLITLRETKIRHYAGAVVARIPLHLAINTALFFVALTFGAKIPFLKVIAGLPMVILAGTIPITPGGLGTIQVATVELFKSSVTSPALSSGALTPAELVFSMSLLFVFANYLLKAVVGAIFLIRRSRDYQSDSSYVNENSSVMT